MVLAQVSSEQEQADVETLRQQGFEVAAIQESKRRAVLRSGLALFGRLPLQVAYAQSASFAQAARCLCEQRTFDVVHVEHLRGINSMQQLIRTYPLVWDAVDCISLLCKHTIKSGPGLPVRAVAMLEQKRTQRYEAKMVNRLPHIIITSERDRQAMIELLRIHIGNSVHSDEELGANIRVLPSGVDLEYFYPIQQERQNCNIVFSGKMSYHANVATALYLHQQIMPLIWQKRPEATLTIAGSNPPESVQRLARDPRVEVTGYVDDIRPYIRRAMVMVCPMVYSVGLQNKVLEGMALGTPVVVASQPASALSARPGRDLLVANSTQEFADAALRLMNDTELRETLSQCGRKHVEHQHDWRMVTNRLVNVYEQAIIAHYRESSHSDLEVKIYA